MFEISKKEINDYVLEKMNNILKEYLSEIIHLIDLEYIGYSSEGRIFSQYTDNDTDRKNWVTFNLKDEKEFINYKIITQLINGYWNIMNGYKDVENCEKVWKK